MGISPTVETTRHVACFKSPVLFLLAFMLYTMAFKPVDMASIYGAES